MFFGFFLDLFDWLGISRPNVQFSQEFLDTLLEESVTKPSPRTWASVQPSFTRDEDPDPGTLISNDFFFFLIKY